MIMKLHKPIYSITEDAPVLSYDRNRVKTFELPMTPALDKLFNGKLKIYCEAHLTEGGSLSIDISNSPHPSLVHLKGDSLKAARHQLSVLRHESL